MKGTPHVLFCGTKWHTSVHACNRSVTLVTGAVTLVTWPVTLVTWPVTLVTHSYMCKNGGEAPEQDAVGASWRQRG